MVVVADSGWFWRGQGSESGSGLLAQASSRDVSSTTSDEWVVIEKAADRGDTTVWLAREGVRHDLRDEENMKVPVYHKKLYEHWDKKMAAGGRMQYW
eukprot:2256680-Rhodomonas_salina.1